MLQVNYTGETSDPRANRHQNSTELVFTKVISTPAPVGIPRGSRVLNEDFRACPEQFLPQRLMLSELGQANLIHDEVLHPSQHRFTGFRPNDPIVRPEGGKWTSGDLVYEVSRVLVPVGSQRQTPVSTNFGSFTRRVRFVNPLNEVWPVLELHSLKGMLTRGPRPTVDVHRMSSKVRKREMRILTAEEENRHRVSPYTNGSSLRRRSRIGNSSVLTKRATHLLGCLEKGFPGFLLHEGFVLSPRAMSFKDILVLLEDDHAIVDPTIGLGDL